MRGVRLPLPLQQHRIHRTARDHSHDHRPTSRDLLAHQDSEPDPADLIPYWDRSDTVDPSHGSLSTGSHAHTR